MPRRHRVPCSPNDDCDRHPSGGELGAASNAVHGLYLQQGLLDIQQSPIYGIGFDHLTEATEVHLQLLAAGGLLGLVGYLVYWFTVVRAGVAARHVDPALATALLVSVLTFLVLNFVENQVADTYLYIPAALLVSLAALPRVVPARETTVPGRVATTPYSRRRPVLTR